MWRPPVDIDSTAATSTVYDDAIMQRPTWLVEINGYLCCFWHTSWVMNLFCWQELIIPRSFTMHVEWQKDADHKEDAEWQGHATCIAIEPWYEAKLPQATDVQCQPASWCGRIMKKWASISWALVIGTMKTYSYGDVP